ncbi:MAG TPA: hypothetical protein ENK50_06180 [Sedimenticola sp.]|nr:hypothetical protein [Sedimenticola sp.]
MIEATTSTRIPSATQESLSEPDTGQSRPAGQEAAPTLDFGQILSDQGEGALLPDQMPAAQEVALPEVEQEGGTELPQVADLAALMPVDDPGAGDPAAETAKGDAESVMLSEKDVTEQAVLTGDADPIGTAGAGAGPVVMPPWSLPATLEVVRSNATSEAPSPLPHLPEGAASGKGRATFAAPVPGGEHVVTAGPGPFQRPVTPEEKAQLPRLQVGTITHPEGDGDRPFIGDNRGDSFASSLGRATVEGGGTSRPVTAPLPAIGLPPGGDQWSSELGDRVLLMVGRSIQNASLRVTPPQLGQIDIHLSLQNDQAQVTFHAHHALVRDALEAAVPRLREMFSENNLQLVNVDVGQRGGSDPHAAAGGFAGQGGQAEGRGPVAAGGGGLEEHPVAPVISYRGDGLLDDFA